jgi:hypothetical protein
MGAGTIVLTGAVWMLSCGVSILETQPETSSIARLTQQALRNKLEPNSTGTEKIRDEPFIFEFYQQSEQFRIC